MEKTSSFIPITITDSAIEEIRSIISKKNIPNDYALRIGVKAGIGCATGGMSFIIGFDQKKETDDVYEIGDLKILLEKRHAMYLVGKEVDYISNGNETGFVFNDPDNS